MSLKAGRVGVNPADVDPINGHISPDSVDSYTKTQADDKFLSKSDAASTYETKENAAALQPKTLAVPIETLSGSKLTVESALQGLNSDKQDKITQNSSTIETTFTVGDGINHIYEKNGLVSVYFNLTGVTATEFSTVIGIIPEGYRPKYIFKYRTSLGVGLQINTNGKIYTTSNVSNAGISLYACWLK